MRITLGDHIVEINERTTTNNQHRVLTSSQKGIVSQDEYFNKQIASKENTGYKIVKRGQFTYRAMSDTGRFYINRLMEYDVGIVSPAYPVFEVIEDNIIYTPYIVLFFESDYFQSLIVNQSTGSTRVSLKLDKIKRISIDIPSYQEQKEIVEKIESAKRAIAARDEQLSCFNELVKSRFIELFGDQESNPFGWTQCTIGECCTLKSGTSLPAEVENEGGSIPYVKVGDMNYPGNERYITTSSRYVSEETAGKGLFGVGSIIFPKRGGAIGTNKKRMTKLPICADLNVMGVSSNGKLLPEYLLAYFELIDLGALSDGSSVPQINNKNIAPLVICIPPMELQNQFATFVEQTDKSKLCGGMEVAA